MDWTAEAAQVRLVRLLKDIKEDSGQSVVIVALAMGLILGVAAFAIDTGEWFQKRHQAQVAADAAALGAANCMAHGGTTTACTTTAVSLASANGISIPSTSVNINTTATTVSVAASTAAPHALSSLRPTVGAHAVASWTSGSSGSCTGTSCYALFAADTNCSGSGAYLQTTDLTIDGAVRSNGALTVASNGATYSSMTYGCSGKYSDGGSRNTFASGSPSLVTGDQSWPEDYTSAFPLSGGSFTKANDPNCTQVGGDLNLQSGGATLANNNTYCFNSIEFNEGGLTCLKCTFVASSITFNNGSGDDFTPGYKGQLLFYDMASGSVNINFNANGDYSFLSSSATSFLPNASVTINAPGGNFDAFVEAQDVSINGGSGASTWQGAGPSSTGGSSTASDLLIQ